MKTYKDLAGKKIQLSIMAVVFICIAITAYVCMSYLKELYIGKIYIIGALAYASISLLAVAYLYSSLLDRLSQSEVRYQLAQADLIRLNKDANEQEKLTKLLRLALENDELTILYQPRVSTKTGKICGAEALVRWFHADVGWISPDEFIPVAEKSDLILQLGLWVVKTVCQNIKKWHDLGFSLKISINLSKYQFRQGDIVKDIAQILWDTQIAPYSLEIELTENVLLENPEKCALMLSVLRSMGVTILVDNFGTGNLPLSYLRRYPISALKIARTFVRNISLSSQDNGIVNAIIAMGKGLKLRIIAEGVETKEQAGYLIKHEVDELQGYHISLPLAEEEFSVKLQEDVVPIISLKH
ncbi:MAG: EAL domain-containing protein [Proteobacteria bacterium]|nr:EAL domain-containing protein [Pseudomonadota bacterium]